MTALFGDWRIDSRAPSSHDVMRGQSDAMRKEIDAAPPEHVLQADAEEWADALARKYAIDVPTVNRGGMTQDPVAHVTVQIPGYTDGFGDAYASKKVPGVRYVVRVPFEGEADVFKYRPSRRLMGDVGGRVVGATLVYEVERPESAAALDLKSEADRWLDRVEDHLGYWTDDVRDFEARLRVVALEEIEARKGHQERIRAAVAASEIPVATPGGGTKTYIPRAIVRKPRRARSRPGATPGGSPNARAHQILDFGSSGRSASQRLVARLHRA